MMRYLNKRTGATVETSAAIVGGDWEAAGHKPAAEATAEKKSQTSQKKRSVKK